MITSQETIRLTYTSIPRHIRKRLATHMYVATHGLRHTHMNIECAKNENLCSSVHRINKNNTDYCIKIMLQQLVASNLAKDREKVRRELCLNVIIPFYIIVFLRLRNVPIFQKK